jgi:type I restriction enzyme S subunit
MSHIDGLIKKHCLNGVKFVRIGDVAVVGTGSSDRKDAVNNGQYPFYVRSREILTTDSFEFDEEAIVIPGEGGVGDIFHYVKGKYALHQRAYRISFGSKEIITRFAYYYFSVHFKQFIIAKAVSATVTSIRKPMICDFLIPFPPIEVQREIVRILDTFSQLEAELESELEARRKQYTFYRDALFLKIANSGNELALLGSVAGIFDGTHQTPKYIDAGIKFVSVENIRALYDSRKCISEEDYQRLYKTKPQRGDVLMTRIGTVGACAVVDREEPLAYYVSLTLIRPVPALVNSRYLKHLLESGIGAKELLKRTLVNAVPVKINLGDIGKLRLPFPSLYEQERIASILDKLESMTNDLNIGLPAELNARRQQYEYYRDKLLTFQETA